MRTDIVLLAGVERPKAVSWPPFDKRVIAFLSELSAAALHDRDSRQWEAVSAFGFWCRRARLETLERRHACEEPRLGRGVVFHVAPSNVPALFGYTTAIGLLAGNANVVRLSTRRHEEDTVLLSLLNTVLDRPEHREVRERLSVISYDRDDAVTADYCAHCDARVVWGGDATVAALRAMPVPPHAVEFMFPDRWSLAVLSQAFMTEISGEERAMLAHRFYNDTYAMDQNACSSPQLILWLEDGGNPGCRSLWWEAVAAEAARRYPFGPYQAARKLEQLCCQIMASPLTASVERYSGNLLYVVGLDALPPEPTALRGGFGLFFQSAIQTLEDILPVLSPKIQTLVCGGLDTGKTARFLADHQAAGVDRVVSLGQALEMDTVWDGKDLISGLSRRVVFG